MEIVAELSCNHRGWLDRAKALIKHARAAGADAVKLQCWHPDRMVVDRGYTLTSGPWKGRNLYELYQEAFTPWEWFPTLFDLARKVGIECFASVFDTEALAFLESLGCPRYKIASFEITDVPLIEAVAKTGKSIVISTGLATYDEILAAYRAAGSVSKTFLVCTSAYPANIADTNLARVGRLQVALGSQARIGVSDHTLGNTVPIVAAALGATMLEKHLCFSRADGGPDAAFSTEPAEFKAMVDACREAEAALGEVRYGPTEAEQGSLQFRRSLYWAKDIQAGETITTEHLMTARPMRGLPPDYARVLIGKHPGRDCAKGESVQLINIC